MMQKAILVSLLAILAVGAGLYVISGRSGNSIADLPATGDTADHKGCSYNAEFAGQIDAAAVGDVAAFRPIDQPLDITQIGFKDSSGNSRKLAEWKGKTVLFNLWATWCPPCREEMPWFDELQTLKGSPEFEVVTVSVDFGEPEKPLEFYRETGLNSLEFLHDGTTETFQILKRQAIAIGMPVTVLIDPEGCAVGAMNGPAHWSGADARHFVDQVLRHIAATS